MANIYWDPEQGSFVTRVAGTDRVVKLGGEEDTRRKNEYLQSQADFYDTIKYDTNKDYSSQFGGLFGAESDRSNEYYYGGPNQNWRHAMDDRRGQRQSGNYNLTGHYEGSTRTMDRGLQAQMAKRNNAIEAMMRQGYSQAQLNDHLAGKRNVLEDGPDYRDFKRARRKYLTGLGGEEATPQWFDTYYIGSENVAPDIAQITYGNGSGATGGFLSGYQGARDATPQGGSNVAQRAPQTSSVGSLFESFINKRRDNQNER